MAQTNHPKPVAHFYTFAFTCLLFALVGISINNVLEAVVTLILAFLASLIAFLISFLVRKIRKKLTVAEPEPTTTANLEVDAVIGEGFALISELQSASQKIRNPDMVRETNRMIDVSHKIIEKLKRQPQLLSSAKRFFNYYLPTTTKLITNYSYMESQGVTGGNISAAMEKIENSVTALANAYKAQLDSLFSHTVMDLETDIAALEQILKQEGLLQKELKGE